MGGGGHGNDDPGGPCYSHSYAPLAHPPHVPLSSPGRCTDLKKKKEKEEREGEESGRKGHWRAASLVVDLLLCCLALDGAHAAGAAGEAERARWGGGGGPEAKLWRSPRVSQAGLRVGGVAAHNGGGLRARHLRQREGGEAGKRER